MSNLKKKNIQKMKYHRRMKKAELVVFFSLLFFFLIFSMSFFNRNFEAEANMMDLPEEKSHAQVTFVGDVMLDRYVTQSLDLYGVEGLFEEANHVLKQADLAIANIESPVIESFENDYYILDKNRINFAIDEETMLALRDESEIDVFSFANNHIGDYGYQGLLETMEILERNDIPSVGIYENSLDPSKLFYVEEINGMKVAIVSVTDARPRAASLSVNTSGAIRFNSKEYHALVHAAHREAKKVSDYVITYVHWGKEYANEMSDRQIEMANVLVDAGTDLIVGSHPHVLQPVQKIQDVYVIPSLGNFVFDQVQGSTSLTAVLNLHFNEEKALEKLEFVPFRIEQARPLIEQSAFRQKAIQKRLTRKIPEEQIEVKDGRVFVEVN